MSHLEQAAGGRGLFGRDETGGADSRIWNMLRASSLKKFGGDPRELPSYEQGIYQFLAAEGLVKPEEQAKAAGKGYEEWYRVYVNRVVIENKKELTVIDLMRKLGSDGGQKGKKKSDKIEIKQDEEERVTQEEIQEAMRGIAGDKEQLMLAVKHWKRLLSLLAMVLMRTLIDAPKRLYDVETANPNGKNSAEILLAVLTLHREDDEKRYIRAVQELVHLTLNPDSTSSVQTWAMNAIEKVRIIQEIKPGTHYSSSESLRELLVGQLYRVPMFNNFMQLHKQAEYSTFELFVDALRDEEVKMRAQAGGNQHQVWPAGGVHHVGRGGYGGFRGSSTRARGRARGAYSGETRFQRGRASDRERERGVDEASGERAKERGYDVRERVPQKCFLCHKVGHQKAQCRSLQCYKCGEKGHMARDNKCVGITKWEKGKTVGIHAVNSDKRGEESQGHISRGGSEDEKEDNKEKRGKKGSRRAGNV